MCVVDCRFHVVHVFVLFLLFLFILWGYMIFVSLCLLAVWLCSWRFFSFLMILSSASVYVLFVWLPYGLINVLCLLFFCLCYCFVCSCSWSLLWLCYCRLCLLCFVFGFPFCCLMFSCCLIVALYAWSFVKHALFVISFFCLFPRLLDGVCSSWFVFLFARFLAFVFCYRYVPCVLVKCLLDLLLVDVVIVLFCLFVWVLLCLFFACLCCLFLCALNPVFVCSCFFVWRVCLFHVV